MWGEPPRTTAVISYGDSIPSAAVADQTWKPVYPGRVVFPMPGQGSESSPVSLMGMETSYQ